MMCKVCHVFVTTTPHGICLFTKRLVKLKLLLLLLLWKTISNPAGPFVLRSVPGSSYQIVPDPCIIFMAFHYLTMSFMSSNIKSSSSTLEFPEFLQDRNILVVKIFNQTNYLVNNNNNNINLLKIK